MNLYKTFSIVYVVLVMAMVSTCTMSDSQIETINKLAYELATVPTNTLRETKLLRLISIALNDRTALEAFLTDPDSASYKAGIISLAQAVKIYAWISRADRGVLHSFQEIANRLQDILLK